MTMNLFRGYLICFVLFISISWTSVQALFGNSAQGIRPWMHYLFAPQRFRLQKHSTRKIFSLIEALTDSYILTKHPMNRCNNFRVTLEATTASARTSEQHKYAATLHQYRKPVQNNRPTLIVDYVNKRQRGQYEYQLYYVTSRPLPLFTPTHSINGLCGSVDILTFHRANIAGYYKVSISVPRPLSVNVSVIHYSSYYESFGCMYDRVTIGYFPQNSSNFLTCFHFCGRSPKRNVLLPTSTADIHLHYQKFSQDSHLRLQFQATQSPSVQKSINNVTFTAQDKERAEFAPACEDFTIPKVEDAFSIRTGQIPFQNINTYDVAYFLTSPGISVKFLPNLQFYKLRLYFPEQDCTGREHGQVFVYDGPYAGVLTSHGLISPYSVLTQGGCHYITNRTVSSSIGDISVVWLNRLRKDYQFQVDFNSNLTSCRHAEFCSARTLWSSHSHTSSITVINKDTPSVQALTFHVTNPNHNIHLNFQVHESTFLEVGEYCQYGSIKIVEIEFVRALYCSKDALKMLNHSGRYGGFQFNNRNITIVLKTYPQSVKLNMTITYRATYTYGLFNINPLAERHQWFSSDALRPGMHCFHVMKLTESPFDGNVLHVIPSNDFSCGIQVMEVYSDYNHEFPIPKQISTIIQYPPYQQANVEMKSIHVHFAHSGPQPVPDCPFEAWFDYAGNIIDFYSSFNVSFAFSTSRADLTFYRGCLYTQSSFVVVIRSGAAVCSEVQMLQSREFYFEANGFCGKVAVFESRGTVIFNSIGLAAGTNKSRCCVGFVQIKAKLLSMDYHHNPIATFRICPNGGEFCNSAVQYKLGPAMIHAIDMTQITGNYVYEVNFEYSLAYRIEFKYKICLLPTPHQWAGISYAKGVAAVAFKHCYGHSCYTFWPDRRPLSWSEANESCSKINMSLLSINTDSEWQNVLQTFWEEEFLFTFIHLGFKEAMVSSRELSSGRILNPAFTISKGKTLVASENR